MKKALVIGSGPAGVSASLYLARSNNIDVTVISHSESALAKAEKIENYFGFAEPVSGEELLKNGIAGAKRLGVTFINAEILDIRMTPEFQYQAVTADGNDIYDAVLIATGADRKSPNIKGITEFEGKGVSYCAICDAFFHRGKPVAVIGNGDYALHEAMTLADTSSEVTVLTDGDKLLASLPDNIKCIEKKIREITGDTKVRSVIFEDGSSIDISGVFIAIGTAGSTDIARKIGAAVNGNKITVDENNATNVPGLYAAGDCIGGLLQISKAVSDGAVAATNMIKFLKNK